MRLHAVMTMQPHCKKRLSPAMVLPLPWDKKTRGRKRVRPSGQRGAEGYVLEKAWERVMLLFYSYCYYLFFSGSLVKYAYKKIIKRMRAEIALMLDVITKIQSQRLCGSCKRRKGDFCGI